jgi:uncharacterized membrane protein
MIQFREILKEKPWILYGIVLSPFLVLIIGCLAFPTIFYDHFIWKYFWGPIISDALEQQVSYHGVSAAPKFTFISEIIYGILVIGALYWLLTLFKKWDISIDRSFFIALLPYIMYGTIARVLEDASFFSEPFVFWFVTPLIYFQSLFIFLGILFIGHIISNHTRTSLSQMHIVFIGGLILLIPFVYFLSQWILGNQWSYSTGVRFDVFLLVSSMLFIIILSVYSIGRIFKDNPSISIYAGLINLSMILGHMLDGLTSWISIYDPFNMGLPTYVEKHPASDFLMQIWPPLFPIVKFILIIIVIYLFDVLYKDELREYPRLVPLLKIGIFILGFAPGLRDLLRVTMGV